MALSVIGAGFPRTGTSSLQLALEQLGFGPCYHMRTIFADHSRMGDWEAAARGEFDDWDKVFAGFQSTADSPSCFQYKALADHFPDAKVVLTVRDSADQWLRSAMNTIFRQDQAIGTPEERLKHPVGRFMNNTSPFKMDRIGDTEHLKSLYERHNAEVIRSVPAERLLVYNVREGWAPLCDFLGAPSDAMDAFPHENANDDFSARYEATFGKRPMAAPPAAE